MHADRVEMSRPSNDLVEKAKRILRKLEDKDLRRRQLYVDDAAIDLRVSGVTRNRGIRTLEEMRDIATRVAKGKGTLEQSDLDVVRTMPDDGTAFASIPNFFVRRWNR